MHPEDINYSAFKYNESIIDSLTDIIQPIFNWDLSTFAYFKFFPNGQYLYLCNNIAWVEHCLRHVQDNDSALGQEINHAKENEFYSLMWPTTPHDTLLRDLYDFDIWNGLSVFKKSSNYVELWGFATTRANKLISNFYLHNIELIKCFIRYFNDTASQLIDAKDTRKLAVYTNIGEGSFFNFEDPYDLEQINNFIMATNSKKYPILTPRGEVLLSQREKQCMHLISFGKTAKEIGLELDISHRTIELYIKNIKSKTNAQNKTELIKIFRKSALEWF